METNKIGRKVVKHGGWVLPLLVKYFQCAIDRPPQNSEHQRSIKFNCFLFGIHVSVFLHSTIIACCLLPSGNMISWAAIKEIEPDYRGYST